MARRERRGAPGWCAATPSGCPQASLAFYTGVLGMRVLRKLDFPEMKFSLYFLARVEGAESGVPEDAGERTVWTFRQEGVLELTHNWGTEQDPGFAYHDGNAQPQGFGHICFAVPAPPT